MQNALIYYRQEKEEDIQNAIDYVNEVINKIEKNSLIKGVFVDSYNERTEFDNLINNSLDNIDLIYLNIDILDEFDENLLNQIARADRIQTKNIYEVE
ncbi:hypothetical protein LG275_13770 (plasmid) [Chryseomicrobium palamuruense]